MPNPTCLCQRGVGPFKDNADPMEDWSLEEVFATQSRLIYVINGKVYRHEHHRLTSSRERLERCTVDFRFYDGDVSDFVPILHSSYDRIEV